MPISKHDPCLTSIDGLQGMGKSTSLVPKRMFVEDQQYYRRRSVKLTVNTLTTGGIEDTIDDDKTGALMLYMIKDKERMVHGGRTFFTRGVD
jgi:hypothetical protein